MTELRPFPGLRYDTAKVHLDDVVSPPYDIIDAEQAGQLRARSSFNIIHVSLPQADAGDKYRHAATLLKDWQDTGVLVEDDEPSIYLVTDSFDLDGRTWARIGLIVAVRLEPFGRKSIFPHEGTLQAPKADRLNLMNATAANISPIMAMFDDPDARVRAIVEDVLKLAPEAECSTPTGTCQLRRLSDADAIGQIVAALKAGYLVIADGHHRYETALAYRDQNPSADDDRADYVMMHLVALQDEALKVLPTHRLVIPEVGPELDELLGLLSRDFELSEMHRPRPAGPSAGQALELPGPEARFGTFLLYAEHRAWRLSLREEICPGDIDPEAGEDWCRLDVSVLQKRVFEPIFGLTMEVLKGEELVSYSHEVAESVRMVDSGRYARAFLMRPTPVTAVAAVAHHLEKMPPKSTYFYPKVSAGLVLRRLR